MLMMRLLKSRASAKTYTGGRPAVAVWVHFNHCLASTSS
jgi:hypothetical protein